MEFRRGNRLIAVADERGFRVEDRGAPEAFEIQAWIQHGVPCQRGVDVEGGIAEPQTVRTIDDPAFWAALHEAAVGRLGLVVDGHREV